MVMYGEFALLDHSLLVRNFPTWQMPNNSAYRVNFIFYKF